MSTTDEDKTELEFNDLATAKGPEDISFPGYAHHLKVRSEVTTLVSEGVLTEEEGEQVFDDWIEARNS